MGSGAPEKGVHAAAIMIGTLARLPRAPGLAKVHDSVGLRWEDAWAPNLLHQQSTGAEADITHDLGVQAQPRLAGEQPVTRIDIGQFSAGARALAVSGGRDDEAVDVLEGPV